MTALLLAFLLIQAGTGTTGFATGIVRLVNGSPASGVRVYAPAGDPNTVSTGATVIERMAQTDASGRYRLEVPAGRYYVAAGSVSSPTYYPDTPSIASAKAITIAAGTTVESVDLSGYTVTVLSSAGALPAVGTPITIQFDSGRYLLQDLLDRPIEVADQQKSGDPLFSAAQLTSVTATVTFEDGTSVPSSAGIKMALTILTAPNGARPSEEVTVPMSRLPDDTYSSRMPTGVRFSLSVENLPEGYSLKSISGRDANTGMSYSGLAPDVISILLRRTTAR